MYAVNIGNKNAAALAFHLSQGVQWTEDVIVKAENLVKYSRRLPYFWP